MRGVQPQELTRGSGSSDPDQPWGTRRDLNGHNLSLFNRRGDSTCHWEKGTGRVGSPPMLCVVGSPQAVFGVTPGCLWGQTHAGQSIPGMQRSPGRDPLPSYLPPRCCSWSLWGCLLGFLLLNPPLTAAPDSPVGPELGPIPHSSPKCQSTRLF